LTALNEIEEKVKAETKSDEKLYKAYRFKTVREKIENDYYSWREDQLSKGITLLDSRGDNLERSFNAQWRDFYSSNRIYSKNKLESYIEAEDITAFKDAIIKIAEEEAYFWKKAYEITVPRLMGKSIDYTRKYPEKQHQLDIIWGGIVGEMRSHGSAVNRIAYAILKDIIDCNQRLENDYKTINENISNFAIYISLGQHPDSTWKNNLTSLTDYIEDFREKLLTNCTKAEEAIFEQKKVMEKYNEYIEPTEALMKEFDKDKATNEFVAAVRESTNFTHKSEGQQKDFLKFIDKIDEKCSVETAQCIEEYEKLVASWKGIFIKFISEDVCVNIFNKRDRDYDWGLISSEIYDRGFLNRLAGIREWDKKILQAIKDEDFEGSNRRKLLLEEISKQTGKPVEKIIEEASKAKESLINDMRSEFDKPSGEATMINQELISRLKNSLYDVYMKNTLKDTLKFGT
jgi:hypothetical protein